MHVNNTITYDGELPEVLRVLISEELAKARADRGGLAAPRHTVAGSDDAPEATTVVTVPADKLPAKARRFMSRDTPVTITQAWDGTGPDRATAAFTVDVGSLPVKVALTQTLVADGGRTTSTFSGDVTVSIPIIGSKIEQMAARRVDSLLAEDQKLVNTILAQR